MTDQTGVILIYKDGSGKDHFRKIDPKYFPLITSLVGRIEKLQRVGTTVYETEKDIYE